ncbi:hypothetical protein HOP54_13095 [Halomonas daqingensis]|uniref:Uncharacterized protein n=1 Tax=Billgrantia desiderata TaxID=52021 RepID=A0AAW4YXR3_9GAMM|nr:hypothetical protein [Halomonas desiderata]MCE8029627.1 hypothetical protein [Halomonas desiderata]MCE8053053.1 hypothetical protein [Halomonas desiderata]
MTELVASLSARELVEDLIPKLKATEHFLSDTLTIKLQNSDDPRETLRLKNLQTEFELELTMIRMNLNHLLRRYSDELMEATDDPEGKGGVLLALDEHEAVAIESIRRLYARSHALQTDSGGSAHE